MWCKFFLCWCHKHLLIKFFIFGDVNNALGPWVSSLQGHIIILRIWIVCTLHVKGYPWERRPNVVHWRWAKQGPSKFKCNILFIKSFKGHKLSKNKVQLLDLTSYLWPTLVGLSLARTIGVHYEIIVIYTKPCLTFFSLIYYLFMQYIKMTLLNFL
jgi:hypothetical protein